VHFCCVAIDVGIGIGMRGRLTATRNGL